MQESGEEKKKRRKLLARMWPGVTFVPRLVAAWLGQRRSAEISNRVADYEDRPLLLEEDDDELLAM